MGVQDRGNVGERKLQRPRGSGRFDTALPPRTLAGFLLATLALFLISYLSYRSLERRTDSAQRMAQTLEVTTQLAAVLSTLKDAETGERGFLLTNAEIFLEPYNAALTAL